MSKIRKSKLGSGTNPRSRASKRDTSPSINTDRSLKNALRPSDHMHVLSVRTNAGVSKSKKSRPKSRAQRIRQEKGVARAEAVMDHLEKKVEGSKKRQRKRRARKGTWDEINGVGKDERRNAVLGADEEINDDEDEWEDQEEEDSNTKTTDGAETLALTTKTKLVIGDKDVQVEEVDEEDKIT